MRFRALSDRCTNWVAARRANGARVPRKICRTICDIEQPRVDHEVQGSEGFVSFVDTMDQVEHLQREIDDEGVEQIFCDGVQAAHVDGAALRRTEVTM